MRGKNFQRREIAVLILKDQKQRQEARDEREERGGGCERENIRLIYIYIKNFPQNHQPNSEAQVSSEHI